MLIVAAVLCFGLALSSFLFLTNHKVAKRSHRSPSFSKRLCNCLATFEIRQLWHEAERERALGTILHMILLPQSGAHTIKHMSRYIYLVVQYLKRKRTSQFHHGTHCSTDILFLKRSCIPPYLSLMAGRVSYWTSPMKPPCIIHENDGSLGKVIGKVLGSRMKSKQALFLEHGIF